MPEQADASAHLSIAAVERDTGLGKDTLRVWERRYGFPLPLRGPGGERLYSADQMEKLRLLKRLMDRGFRPGKLVGASADELVRLLGEESAGGSLASLPAELLGLVRLSSTDELRVRLGHGLARLGLQRFVIEVLAPLNAAVGDAWLSGRISVADEHVYTETVETLLRGAIGVIPPRDSHPRVLLTTFPNEQHALGLLMAEALLSSEGAHCVSLGTETPIADIPAAAQAGAFDIVALSFSSAYSPRRAAEGLTQLRAELPPTVQLWAGGQALTGKAVAGVLVLDGIADALQAVHEWRTGK